MGFLGDHRAVEKYKHSVTIRRCREQQKKTNIILKEDLKK